MSEHKFKKQVNVEIDYDSEKPKGFDYESRSSKVDINYAVSIDIRDWGIKDISPYSHEQEIEIELELQDQKTDDIIRGNFKIKLEDVQTEIEDITRHICPHQINLDLKNIVQIGEKEFKATAKGILIF